MVLLCSTLTSTMAYFVKIFNIHKMLMKNALQFFHCIWEFIKSKLGNMLTNYLVLKLNWPEIIFFLTFFNFDT